MKIFNSSSNLAAQARDESEEYDVSSDILLADGDGDDQSTTSDDGTSSGMSSGNGKASHGSAADEESQGEEYKEVQRLAKKETGRIQFCRLVVVLTIIVTGAVIATATYLFLSNDERATYEKGVRVN